MSNQALPRRVSALRTGAEAKGRPETRNQSHAAVAREGQRSSRCLFWLGNANLRPGGSRAAGFDRVPARGGLAALLACVWLEILLAIGLESVEDQYGALPFIYGTVVSSLLALVIAVPLSIGVAVFITEMCPVGLRGILSFTTELLAAIPAWSMDFGQSSCWCRFFANMSSRFSPKRSAGRRFSAVRPTHRHARCGRDSGDHGHSHRFVHRPRGARRGSAASAGSGARAGRDALGNDPHGSLAKCARRNHGSHHSGPGRALGETMASPW